MITLEKRHYINDNYITECNEIQYRNVYMIIYVCIHVKMCIMKANVVTG